MFFDKENKQEKSGDNNQAIMREAVRLAFDEIYPKLKELYPSLPSNYKDACEAGEWGLSAVDRYRLTNYMYIRVKQLVYQKKPALVEDVKYFNLNSQTDRRLKTKELVKRFNYPAPKFSGKNAFWSHSLDRG